MQARQQQAQLVLQNEELQSEVNRTEHLSKGAVLERTKSTRQLDGVKDEATHLRVELVEIQNELAKLKGEFEALQNQNAASTFASASQKQRFEKKLQNEAKGSERLQTLLDTSEAENQNFQETISAHAEEIEDCKLEIERLKELLLETEDADKVKVLEIKEVQAAEVAMIDTAEVERLTSELARVNAMLEEGSNAVQEFEDEVLGQAQQAIQADGLMRVQEITSACEVERQQSNDELAEAQSSLSEAVKEESAEAKAERKKLQFSLPSKSEKKKRVQAKEVNTWLSEQVCLPHTPITQSRSVLHATPSPHHILFVEYRPNLRLNGSLGSKSSAKLMRRRSRSYSRC